MTGRDHRAGAPLARIAAIAGVAATLATIGIGIAMLLGGTAATRKTLPTAERITVSPAPTFPLSGAQIADLVHQPPDYGALADLRRRASCLAGLGYPTSTALVGARLVDVTGRPAVVLVLRGDEPGDLVALLVDASCSAADTGLITDTRVRTP